MTDRDFLLAVLADGKPHPLTEIIRLSISERGHGFTVHSRAADLRRDGYTIKNWPMPKGQRGSVYQLIASPLGTAADLEPGPQFGFVPAAASSGPLSAASATAQLSRHGAAAALSGPSAAKARAIQDRPDLSGAPRGSTTAETPEPAPLSNQPSLFDLVRGAYDDEWRAA